MASSFIDLATFYFFWILFVSMFHSIVYYDEKKQFSFNEISVLFSNDKYINTKYTKMVTEPHFFLSKFIPFCIFSFEFHFDCFDSETLIHKLTHMHTILFEIHSLNRWFYWFVVIIEYIDGWFFCLNTIIYYRLDFSSYNQQISYFFCVAINLKFSSSFGMQRLAAQHLWIEWCLYVYMSTLKCPIIPNSLLTLKWHK